MNKHAFVMIARAALAIVAVLALPGSPRVSVAQGTKEDYARADALRELTRNKVFRAKVEPHWSDDGDRFWYRNDLADGAREFIAVDATAGTRRQAFDHAKLAEALARATGKPQKATHLDVDRLAFPKEGSVVFEAGGKPWRYDAEAGIVEPGESGDKASDPARDPGPRRPNGRRSGSARRAESPDGNWVAFTKDHDIYLRNKETGEELPLGEEGIEKDGYESGVFWSPDSKKLVALRTAKGDDRKVYLIESAPKYQLQPKLQSYDYLKPGDRVAVTKPHLFDVAMHKEIAVRDDLFANPWSIGDYRWSADSSRFTFLYNQRGHQALRLVALDAASGEAKAIIDERSETFIDYAHKTFLQQLEETGEILWMSERDGWNHLYLFDARTGELKNQITRGDWVVRGVDRVDEEGRQIWFHASGVRPGQDPYYVHHCRVNFDGSGLVVLTEGDGMHQVEFSQDRRFLIDTYSRVDMPPVCELRSAKDGALICELERADWAALLSTGWQVPERFVAKARDGKTDIYGVIFRPTRFQLGAKYPVIEQIYAGPQGAFVPKAFAPSHGTQSLAELGFIVVQVDGLGTNWRGKAFHDVCWKNLGDAGFPDRILWMKAAAAKYPAMDLTRVGVYGGSAGGQNALGAVLTHGEFYKAAVADCGCHDNRMDKIWWNEAWMGWPIGPHYAEQSNVTLAHKLRGKLLLMVGELDRNVDPASTMQVVDALIKARKDFELVVFPGAGHGAGGSPYGERRRRDFFVKHLLGVEPPDRNEPESKDDVQKPSSSTVRAETDTGTPETSDLDTTPSEMRGVIERYAADYSSLRRSFPIASSSERRDRMKRFYEGWLEALRRLDFDSMGRVGRIDFLLLKNEIDHELRQMDARAKAEKETAPLVPFGEVIIGLEESRRRMEGADPARTASVLTELKKSIQKARKSAEADRKAEGKSEGIGVSKTVANRAAREVDGLRGTLKDWSGFYNGYDPLFTWWVGEPYKEVDKALQDYATYLREKIVGTKAGDDETIVGDPIGRDVLMDELAYAMIPYTPEELVEIANKEFAWCEAEMKRASHEMGYGDDWKKALEHVKTLHVEPGKQPALIRELALEAIRFVDEHDLVTVPRLARDSWRMEMMSPQRQLVNPFFTGGEVISVSYPTNTMTHEQKLMSMRGNNIHFSRATVHHELIPGHHLQGYMAARHRPYRRLFGTPFWIEGWPLYWETLLWDMKFPRTPEDRVGMLFWRMHRCARIIFSLGFHLGTMSPQECIDFLVERVGHEVDNATAEVRRSFNGSYEPLYQSAYMLGGLQIRALRRELVDTGKVTDRAFHDALLRENSIPIELMRASLNGQELTRDFSTRWRFYEANRAEP